MSQALADNFETRVHAIIMPIIVTKRCTTIVQHSSTRLALCCGVQRRCPRLSEDTPCARRQPQRLIYRRRWFLTLPVMVMLIVRLEWRLVLSIAAYRRH